VVRKALEQIADDEARHAALAFRFVTWALSVEPTLLPVVNDVFARSQAEARDGKLERARRDAAVSNCGAAHDVSALLEQHGVLAPRSREAARAVVLAEILPGVFDVLGACASTPKCEPPSRQGSTRAMQSPAT
jgi:hypothetical protein